MSTDSSDVLGPDSPLWLRRFVHDEVRPLILRHRQAALAAVYRWLSTRAEQVRRRDEWNARRDEFLAHLTAPDAMPGRNELQRLTDDGNPHEPGTLVLPEDFRLARAATWDVGWVGGREVPRRSDRVVVAGGWGPADLAGDEPPVDDPLPPPTDRDLSVDECWAAVVAVHDAARDPRERFVPDDSSSFAVLRGRVRQLTEDDLPDLRAMMRTASATTLPDTTDPGDTSALSSSTQGPIPAAFSGGSPPPPPPNGPHSRPDIPPARTTPLPPARHSRDFRSVHWFGTDYTFTPTQAACVKVLWGAWANGTPELGQETVLEHPEVEADSKRLVDVFKGHPAWGTMIVTGRTAGSFRLAEPTAGD